MKTEQIHKDGIRRIVTGHDNDHLARVIIDDTPKNCRQSFQGVSSTLIWMTDRMPPDVAAGSAFEDMGARTTGMQPPRDGSRFVVIEFQPGDSAAMHRTDTLDYIVVLSGEIEMQMLGGSVLLRAGDVAVQRGTEHAWANPGTIPARVACILLDAAPRAQS